ncbi:carbohydrate kinase [Agrobacterium vitis]|uniref:Carbohydrate kinase n=1 Tax=Agrobacterium vitis TaxID=373 RepID=A0ABD6GB70_AGRVI|nr:carbohydrate kinase [Agrobacterium vitis]MUO79971.1 carbohydrate kinase [Agrobacterium vitis]MUO93540.1 carbohydrate kinase [Agrobacterium vitis]MUP04209.1 carbohydrate kinase [Agrobacterium vitis]MUZ84307.1 carbohydrate kinase [Agrobacterium vitis]MVA11132.1 carbohydrate kinase [Agrobacterium vitis]
MILCCGEALIDMLPRETTLGEKGFSPYAGGAVFNTGIALGRLGVASGFFTGLSDDMMGDILRDTLRASHVDFSYCATLSRPTTIAFVKLVDGHATYAFYDENTAGRMITEADLPALGEDCEALHFGAISLIPEPCGSTYEALLNREHETRVISLDPNIRPGFIKDKAAHMARIRRMAALSDIVKFSDEDLAWFGLEGDEDTLARHWLHHGAKLVVVTRGADGAVGYTADHKVEVPSEKVTVVDTVGAGDTFDAGVLASLKMQNLLTKQQVAKLTQEQIAKALALGSKAAAVTVSRAGANPPFAHEIGL